MIVTQNKVAFEVDRDKFIEWIKDFILSGEKKRINSFGECLGNIEWNIDKIQNKADALFLLELLCEREE